MRGGLRLIGVTGALLSLAVAGCGKSEKEKLPDRGVGAQPRSLKINVAGTAKKPNFTLPDSTRAGLTRIDFSNDAQGMHSLQFVLIDGQHSDADAVKAAGAWADGGKPLPDWIHPAGGATATRSGTMSSTIQMLPRGHYVLIDTEIEGPTKVAATLEATGDTTGAVSGAPYRITEYDYGFKTVGLTHAATRILIENTGKQPHVLDAAPLKPGKTIADVKSYLKSQKGPSPVDDKQAVSTPVLDKGQKMQTSLRLNKGRYVLLCFVSDRKGGPPHAFKGMVAVANVK